MGTVDEALIPAKQWRVLAKQCVDHHLTLNHDHANPNKQQQKSQPTATNSNDGFGYIALHARIEPEMLAHKCGKDMERNLTTLLNLVEHLSIDYNSIILNSNGNGDGDSDSDGTNNATTEESPISEKLRNTI